MNKKMITGAIMAVLMVICLFPEIVLADGGASVDNTQAVQSPQSTDNTQSAGDITGLDNTISSSNTITANGTYQMSSYASGDTITINSSLTVTLSGSGSATYTNFQIVCNPGVNLTLSNVNIDDSANSGVCPLKFNGTGNTLTLAAGTSSTLKGGENNPAVCANLCLSQDTVLTINGTGTLDATGGDKAPGIGSGGNSGKINISGGTITARGGSMAAGIGTGDSDSSVSYPGDIHITGGTVYAYGGFGSAGIGGGYADYGSIMSITGGTVFACRGENGTFDIGSGYSSTTGIGSCAITDPAAVFVQNDRILSLTTSTNHYTYSAGTAAVCGITMPSGWTGAFGAYLHICKVSYNTQGASTTPSDTQGVLGHTVTLSDGSGVNLNGKVFDKWNTKSDGTGTSYAGGASYTVSANATLYAILKEKISSNGTYSLGGDGFKNGDIVAIAGGLTVTLNGKGATYTEMQILCGDNVKLTLNNVKIDDSSYYSKCPLSFSGSSNTLTIPAGTSSVLSGGDYRGGVEAGGTCGLTINGEGILTANGGMYGPGIGGPVKLNGGNITIAGGTINANGGEGGAGIGGAMGSSFGIITISGGTVYAYSGANGAGIGSGGSADGSTIKITGGTVFSGSGIKGTGVNDIGQDSSNKAGTINISGTAMLFLMHDQSPSITTDAHRHFSFGAGTKSVMGTSIPSSWTGAFGAYLRMCNITYDPNFTGLTSFIKSYPTNNPITIGDNDTFHRAGYYIESWNTKADGSGTRYEAGGTYPLTQDLTLYAQWHKPIVTAVSSNAAYGSVTGGSEYDYGTDVTVTATVKAGCYFLGWYNGDTKVTADASYKFTVLKDVTLTARFDKTGVPSTITASSSAYNKITVKWSAAAGAKGYYIYRSTSANGTYKKIGSSKKTSYVNSGVTTGITYYYKVAAYSKTSTCKYYSDVASATPTLGKVTKVTAKSSYPTKAVIKWKAVTGAKKYQVLRSDTKDGFYTAVKTTSSKTITDTGLIPGKTYYYKVVAYRGSAYSAESDIVSVTTKAVK